MSEYVLWTAFPQISLDCLNVRKKYFILTLEKKWSSFCFSCVTSAPLLLRIAVNDPLKRRNILYDCCKTARYTLSWTSSLWYSQYSAPSFTLTTNGIFTVWKQRYTRLSLSFLQQSILKVCSCGIWYWYLRTKWQDVTSQTTIILTYKMYNKHLLL